MGKAVKIVGYFIGTIIILFGLLLLSEFSLESSGEETAPLIQYYLPIGIILIVIGLIVIIITLKKSKKMNK